MFGINAELGLSSYCTVRNSCFEGMSNCAIKCRGENVNLGTSMSPGRNNFYALCGGGQNCIRYPTDFILNVVGGVMLPKAVFKETYGDTIYAVNNYWYLENCTGSCNYVYELEQKFDSCKVIYSPYLSNPYQECLPSGGIEKSYTSIAETRPLPEVYDLSQNRPNPFNPYTVIDYSLPIAGFVEIIVFNILGQHVVTLVSGVQEAGFHTAYWDGKDSQGSSAATGVYLCRMKCGDFASTKKLVILK